MSRSQSPPQSTQPTIWYSLFNSNKYIDYIELQIIPIYIQQQLLFVCFANFAETPIYIFPSTPPKLSNLQYIIITQRKDLSFIAPKFPQTKQVIQKRIWESFFFCRGEIPRFHFCRFFFSGIFHARIERNEKQAITKFFNWFGARIFHLSGKV